MKVEETCNDVYAVDIILNKDDLKNLKRGKLVFYECLKSDAEIYISMEEK